MPRRRISRAVAAVAFSHSYARSLQLPLNRLQPCGERASDGWRRERCALAHTITSSRGRRSCVRRAYFRRRNTRHASRAQSAAHCHCRRRRRHRRRRPFFLHFISPSCDRARQLGVYIRVFVYVVRALVCAVVSLRYYKWYLSY